MKRFFKARTLAVFSIIPLALLVAACEEKSIREIQADPHRYADKDVGVVGTVVESYSILGRGAYLLDDGTGRLWIVSDKGVPRKGARVGVKGKIQDGFSLGSFVKLPAPIADGMVMIAEKHKVKSSR